MSDPSAQSHTNESRRVVSEVESMRAELEARDREIQTWKDTVRDRTYELSQAKKEAAELREDPYAWWESAKRVNARLRDEVQEYAFLFELQKGRLEEAAAAWREATGRHNVSPDLGVLLEWLLGYREHAEKLAEALVNVSVHSAYRRPPRLDLLEQLLGRCGNIARKALAAYRESQNADTSPQVSADRDTKVAPEATILQEKDTHFACNDETVLIECAVRLEALGGYGDIADMLWAAADTYTQEET